MSPPEDVFSSSALGYKCLLFILLRPAIHRMAVFTPRSLTEMIEVPLNLCGVSGFGPFLIDMHWGWENMKYDRKHPFCQSYACLLKRRIFHYQVLQRKSNSSCHEYVKESQIRPEVCYLYWL